MGGVFGKLVSIFWRNKEAKILLIGLDNAGKTSILYKLKLGELINTYPTIGFNLETVEYNNIKFTVWDVGGQDKIRKLWQYYFVGNNGIIFVIDSSDTERYEEVTEELFRTIGIIPNVPILILSNKEDLNPKLKISEISIKLSLHDIKNRLWHIQSCSAITGNGIYEGLDWLSRNINP